MSKDMLEDFCDNVSFILSRASVDEALINKPGNASRYRDIKSVKFTDIVYSALLMQKYYKEACMRKRSRKYESIYKLLYEAIHMSKKHNIDFSIFGTAMQLLPIAYSSLFTLAETISRASQLIFSLNKEDSYYFSLALKELNLSYLGKISHMDYREIEKYDLIEVLLKTSDFDSAVKNMITSYKYSLEVVNEIRKRGLEEGTTYSSVLIMCELPDGLIYRKFGAYVALKVSEYACQVLENYSNDRLNQFDKFLVDNGFNPGSTADIIATGIALYYLDEWYKENSLNYTGTMQRACDRFS